MFVIFVAAFLFLPGLLCSPVCFDVTHSDCSGYPDPLAEKTVTEYESCHSSCNDDYGSQCKFFIFDSESGSKNCKIFGISFREFLNYCNVMGGPKEQLDGCDYDNPADNTCHVFRGGNCKYAEPQRNIIQTKGWNSCQSACKALDCQYWTFKIKEAECLLLKSADRDCAWQFSPKSPSVDDCGGNTPTTPDPDHTTTENPDHTTTNNPDHTTTNKPSKTTSTTTTPMPTTTMDTCFLKESGSPSGDSLFKGNPGDRFEIYCENIDTNNGPCFMKKKGYENGTWLTVDPNQPFVLNCHGDLRPELKPMQNGKCGLEISHVDTEHVGKWTCGSMKPDGSSIQVVSTATLCEQPPCGNLVEFRDICGCFFFSAESETMSWDKARKKCKSTHKGDLVTMDSYWKQTTIFEHWNEMDMYLNPWIGAHKDGGDWKWASNGETIPDHESDYPYANWDWGQPADGNCAYISKLGYGAWASDDCNYDGPYICEVN